MIVPTFQDLGDGLDSTRLNPLGVLVAIMHFNGGLLYCQAADEPEPEDAPETVVVQPVYDRLYFCLCPHEAVDLFCNLRR